jgi:NADH-quinone oxidoreductase B subunit
MGIKKRMVSYCRKKSPWILHVGAGGCNGCSVEILASLTPRYDVERFGILSKGSPRHADIIVIEGIVTKKMKDRLLKIYHQIPNPKFVMAIGSCAISGGVFYDSYNFEGPLDKIIPVDVYVPGCPPKPEAIIDGVVKLLKKLDGK